MAIWHRRAGKDSVGLNWTVVSAFQRPGLYWHLLPTYQQGRKILWDGITKDGRAFLSHWPEPLVQNVNNVEMKLEMKNGSIWQVVGTDNVDRLVGANPVGCIFSEYALQDKRAWDYIRPILAENGGWALFIYTPRGRNHGYDLYQLAKRNENWFADLLTVEDTHAIPISAVDEEREAGMPEELFQQEFFCSFDASLVGSYYGRQMKWLTEEGRITDVRWEPNLPVDTWWDLGMHDATAIWFVQQFRNEIRVIDYYEGEGLGFESYAEELKKRPYSYGEHIGPHDLKVRELGTGKSRVEVARDWGLYFKIAKNIGVQEGINAVRSTLPKCWFDQTKCYRGLEGLRQYRKEFDDKRGMFREKPHHDEHSHPADAFRIGCVAYTSPDTRSLARPAFAVGTDYDPFSDDEAA